MSSPPLIMFTFFGYELGSRRFDAYWLAGKNPIIDRMPRDIVREHKKTYYPIYTNVFGVMENARVNLIVHHYNYPVRKYKSGNFFKNIASDYINMVAAFNNYEYIKERFIKNV